MPVKHTTIAAGTTLTALGVVVGLAIGSGGSPAKLDAQTTQPVEVRTQVIRRTVNVYRHTKPHHVASGTGPGSPGVGSPYAGAASTRTRSSGVTAAQAPTSAPTAVTRSSGVHASAPAASSAPVSTRSSGATGGKGGSGTSKGVSTRSSGGGDGSHHDD
jgi:hypothetical protein